MLLYAKYFPLKNLKHYKYFCILNTNGKKTLKSLFFLNEFSYNEKIYTSIFPKFLVQYLGSFAHMLRLTLRIRISLKTHGTGLKGLNICFIHSALLTSIWQGAIYFCSNRFTASIGL